MKDSESPFDPFDHNIQGEVPPDLDSIPGTIFISNNASLSPEEIAEHKADKPWIDEGAEKKKRTVSDFWASYGTGVLVGAVTLFGGAAIVVGAREYKKRKSQKKE